MKQKIRTGLKWGLATILIGIGLSFNSGCDDSYARQPQQSTQIPQSTKMAVGAAVISHMARTNPGLNPNQRQGFGALGDLMDILSHQEAMREAGKAAKSEVNQTVNVYGESSGKDVIYLKDGGIIEGEIVDISRYSNTGGIQSIEIKTENPTDFKRIYRNQLKGYVDR